MSFVDARVIQARMAKKDARLAKEPAKGRAKMRTKQTGRHDASPSCPAASTASPQSTDEVPMTPKTDPSTTPPVRTDNKVHSADTARKPLTRRTKSGNIIPRQRANTLYGRVVYQLRVAALFIRENDLEEYTLFYDGVRCDGSCLAEELDGYADALEMAIAPPPPEEPRA